MSAQPPFPWYELSIKDVPLLEYNNIFVANLIWINRGVDKDIATFDLVVREIPEEWNFYIFDGLDRLVDMLVNYGFDDQAVDVLKRMNLIDSPENEKFYREFKFSGDVWAMKDGTIFFPGEPIVRVTARLPEANLLTAFMLNVLSYPIRSLTKHVRLQIACKDRLFLAGSLVRLGSFDQGIWSTRASFLLETPNASPIFFRKFPQYEPTGKIAANINHAVIKSFPTERAAYRHVIDNLMEKAYLFFVMIDTYDLKKGLEIFIEEIKKTPNLTSNRLFVTIDSGNVQEQAFYVRQRLDEAGLSETKILAMSNLDEYIIDKMVQEKTPVDYFISATALINITDCPKLEAVYKMAELRHEDGTIEYKAKLTQGKESYPARKQIFRVIKEGKMAEDIIGFEDENLGEPLLHCVIKNGEPVNPPATMEEIMEHLKEQMSTLPESLKTVYRASTYKVTPSQKLLDCVNKLRQHHIGE